MLNAVAGTYFVDGGSITVDGADITRLPEHKRAKFIGRVFQDPMMGTAADMWIEENMALANRRGMRRSLRWSITKKERKNTVKCCLNWSWGWKTGFPPRWDCFPEVSARH